MPKEYGDTCEGCPYRHSGGPPLSMEENGSRVLLMFQGPGVEETQHQRPIISQHPSSAAARIRAGLSRVGLQRQDFNITNATQCFPGKKLTRRDKQPAEIARRACLKWLMLDIEKNDYRRIVVFGLVAKRSVKDLGYGSDERFVFRNHPNGGLKNVDLDSALRPERKRAEREI